MKITKKGCEILMLILSYSSGNSPASQVMEQPQKEVKDEIPPIDDWNEEITKKEGNSKNQNLRGRGGRGRGGFQGGNSRDQSGKPFRGNSARGGSSTSGSNNHGGQNGVSGSGSGHPTGSGQQKSRNRYIMFTLFCYSFLHKWHGYKM